MNKSDAVQILLTVAIKGRNAVTRQQLSAAVEVLQPAKKKKIDPSDARRKQAKEDAEKAIKAEQDTAEAEAVGVFTPEVVTTVTVDE